MIPLQHSYRQFRKNLFLGEEFILFEANPSAASLASSEENEDGKVLQFPNKQNQAQEGQKQPTDPSKKTDKKGELIEGKFQKGEPQLIYKNLKDVVKDNPELDGNKEYQTSWISMLGDYNGIQIQIDRFSERKKQLLDDKTIKDNPEYQAEFRKMYEEMSGVLGRKGINLDPKSVKRIEENLKEEAREKIKRGPLIKDLDAVLAALMEKRKQEFMKLMKYMLGNLMHRLEHLFKKWEGDCPEGYEDVQEAWMEYCINLMETLEKTDFTQLDFDDPNFPGADEGYKQAKDWLYSVSLFEDTYQDFKRASKAELSKQTLETQFKDLAHSAEIELTEAKVKNYQEKMDAIVKEIDGLLPVLKQKSKDPSLTEEERKMRASEIFSLEKNKEKLLEKRDVKRIVNDTLYSEELLSDSPFNRAGITVPLKKGLKGQLEFFNTAPLNTEERRLLLRSMNDGMKEMKIAFQNIEVEANVKFVQTLESLRLYKKNLEDFNGPEGREVIWINPFEAWGHVWHSVTTTIKGNVETQAKRGAGYLQKQGTKWMASIPNPLNIQLIKSLQEFSSNGEQEAEHAEHGRVSEIQKGYEGYNTEHLLHIASETVDRWEFKACLNLLADRGRINWYEPWIYTQLNRWQKTVVLPTDPNWHRTYITASDEMMRQAFVYIYRVTDDFKNLKNKNTGSWESKKGEFQKGLGLLAAEPGGLKKEADKLLEKFKEDLAHSHGHYHPSKADPIKYEAIIHYAIEQGKMQGEDRMYYINQGIASGFLPFDRGAELTKLNNTYPPVDRFDSETPRGARPSIFDIKEWACHDKVTNIYDVFETLSDNTLANQRVNKTISQGANRVDHDDAPMLAGHIDAETVAGILKKNGQGGYGLPSTGLQSLVVGHEFWLDMYAHRYDQKPKEFNDAQLSRFATMFMRFDGITSRQMYAADTNFWRLDDTVAKTEEPRTGGSYKALFGHETLRGSNKIADYINSVKGYLQILDFDKDVALLTKLNNKELRSPDNIKQFIKVFKDKCGPEAAKKVFGEPPIDNVDKLYEVAIPAYIGYINEKHPERVQEMVKTINADHKKVWDAQDKARKEAEAAGRPVEEGQKSLIYRLQEVAKKQNAIRQEAYDQAQGKAPDPHAHGHGHGDHGDHGHGHDEHGAHGGHGDEHGHAEAAHHREVPKPIQTPKVEAPKAKEAAPKVEQRGFNPGKKARRANPEKWPEEETSNVIPFRNAKRVDPDFPATVAKPDDWKPGKGVVAEPVEDTRPNVTGFLRKANNQVVRIQNTDDHVFVNGKGISEAELRSAVLNKNMRLSRQLITSAYKILSWDFNVGGLYLEPRESKNANRLEDDVLVVSDEKSILGILEASELENIASRNEARRVSWSERQAA